MTEHVGDPESEDPRIEQIRQELDFLNPDDFTLADGEDPIREEDLLAEDRRPRELKLDRPRLAERRQTVVAEATQKTKFGKVRSFVSDRLRAVTHHQYRPGTIKMVGGGALLAVSLSFAADARSDRLESRTAFVESSVETAKKEAAEVSDSMELKEAMLDIGSFTVSRGLELECPLIGDELPKYTTLIAQLRDKGSILSPDGYMLEQIMRTMPLSDIRAAGYRNVTNTFCDEPAGIARTDLRQFYFADEKFRIAIAGYGDRKVPEWFDADQEVQTALDTFDHTGEGKTIFYSAEMLGWMLLNLGAVAITARGFQNKRHARVLVVK